ncbi:MAG: hypothetical protein IKA05_08215 [Clostridia bacterium]|nr:hypothetical protein [Clostridia bacterium]MBR3996892.1 hypothetical protein [Clostridia bacterium]
MTEGAWLLKAPAYDGGVCSEQDFNIGYGKSIQEDTQTSRMQLVANTNAAEYLAYLEKLEKAGYVKIFENEINGNLYAQFLAEDGTLYVYYVRNFGEVRVIEDRVSTPIDLFGYALPDGEGEDTTVIYQYGMMYLSGKMQPEAFVRRHQAGGMFYIIRLADRRLILIDGGWMSQSTEKSVPEALKFLYEVSGTPEGEKIKVAAVIITHPHGDHKQFVHDLIKNHSDCLDIERFCYNIASFNLIEGHNPTYPDFGALLCEKYPEALFLKPHTGQSFMLGDMKIDVLFTHEDVVTADKAVLAIKEVNNTTVVMKFTIHGKTFMLLGDIGTQTENPDWKVREDVRVEARFLGMYRDAPGSYSALLSDMVQVAHHAVNDRMGDYYFAIRAPYVMHPGTDMAYESYHASFYYRVFHQLIAAGAEEILPGGTKTYWFEIDREGAISIGSEPLRGADDDYLEYIKSFPAFDIRQIPF